jgi:uncharacterized protein (DUF58 family)
MPDNVPLASPDFLRRLEGLRMLLRRGSGGGPTGGRITRTKGGVSEFESHRDYAPGDDLRAVDWFAYARTGRLVVKEFARDEVVRLRVVLDGSASMAATPAKWRRAREVAAALCALALFTRAGTECCVTRSGRLELLGAADAEPGLRPILEQLERVEAAGDSAPVAALNLARRGPWATALVSDLLDPADPRPALANPVKSGSARPALEGAYSLAAAESGRTLDCVAGPELLQRYAAALAALRERWARAAAAGGARFIAGTTGEPVEAIVSRLVNPVPARGGGAA